MQTYRRLLLVALSLTLVVVVFGAYVRLADAGLGCPDWPGCYGKLTPAHAAEQILDAHVANPHGPVSLPKAWKEMIHRYLASGLGLLIIAIALRAWRLRREPGSAPWLASGLVGVVVFQGMLGMWTVTLLLKPAIVTAHLLGGLATLALLVWLSLRAFRFQRAGTSPGMLLLGRLGLVLLVAQITLGGWTSTNYAALACSDFPTCHGSWWPEGDYANAFHVVRELGMTPDGELLSLAALTAIHWMHRVGAVLAGGVLFLLAWLLSRRQATQHVGLALLACVVLQVLLGVANVVFGLPLLLAVAHNAGAALLVVVMICVNYRLVREGAAVRAERRGNERTEHKNSYA
ncbi:MAG TPA: COX15/CtaA family protein [Rhodocyclaceae bacterium]|nr:COX15/CtaA family protein [Rhodocyclaceae bacterium]